jgi:nucleoside 2-deoxyribosyltransferase
MHYVYCSGPLFCPEEIAGMNALAKVLEGAGFGTFLPHRDGLERYVLSFLNTPLNRGFLGLRERIDRAIFALDVYQIAERCDYFVFNMNGRVPDEGGVAEAGIAFAVGKPVVLYKNDYRSAFNGKDNSMLIDFSILDPISDSKQLPRTLLQAEEILTRSGSISSSAPSGNLSRIVSQGKKIWRVINAYPVKKLGQKDFLPLFQEMVEITDGG